MTECSICRTPGRRLCYPCQGKIAAASPKFKLARAKCAVLYGNFGTLDGRIRGGRRRCELYGDPGTFEGRSKGGRNGPRDVRVRNGRKVGLLYARIIRRPTWPEVRFYGLVLGDTILQKGFAAQQYDGYGVYDGAWPDRRVIVELDGGGHHAFEDRRVDDSRKDISRMLEGNTVLRENDENVLYLKALAILGGT